MTKIEQIKNFVNILKGNEKLNDEDYKYLSGLIEDQSLLQSHQIDIKWLEKLGKRGCTYVDENGKEINIGEYAKVIVKLWEDETKRDYSALIMKNKRRSE